MTNIMGWEADHLINANLLEKYKNNIKKLPTSKLCELSAPGDEFNELVY